MIAAHENLRNPGSMTVACGNDERVVYNQLDTITIKEPSVLVSLKNLLAYGPEYRPPIHLVLNSKESAKVPSSHLFMVSIRN